MSEQELLSLAFLLQSLGFVALILVARVHREKLNQQLCDAKKQITKLDDKYDRTAYALKNAQKKNAELVEALKMNNDVIEGSDTWVGSSSQNMANKACVKRNRELIEQMEKGGMV